MSLEREETAEQPLVSVIVPVYNCAEYLSESLESIFRQNYSNIEVIVINDGSTDNTLEVAQSFGRGVIVVSKKNGGPAAARNKGLSISHGEYIAFLDGDDCWLPGKLKRQVSYLKGNTNTNVVYGGFIPWGCGSDGRFPLPTAFENKTFEVDIDPELSGWIYHRLLFDSWVHIITALVRRSLIDKVGGFREDLRLGEDYEFWIRVSRVTRIDKLATPLALYRVHGQSVTAMPSPINYEYLVIKEAVDRWGYSSPDGTAANAGALKDRLEHLCFRHGYSNYWGGCFDIAKASFKESLRYRWFQPKTVVYYLISIFRALVEKIKC